MGSYTHAWLVKTLVVIGGVCIALTAYQVAFAQSGTSSALTHPSRIPPVGSVIAWYPNLDGTPDLANLPEGGPWVPCDGRRLDNPVYEGTHYYRRTLPNLNGERRFLRGGSKSGAPEDGMIKSHAHGAPPGVDYIVVRTPGPANQRIGGSGNQSFEHGKATHTFGGNETRPKNRSVVWIIRVK